MSQKIVHRDLDLSLLIKGVCARPQMYVGSDENFQMIATFIAGFAHASDVFDDELREFSFWLGSKLKLPRNVVWSWNLEEIYPNFTDALEKLPVLFEEFRKDKEAEWSFGYVLSSEMEGFKS